MCTARVPWGMRQAASMVASKEVTGLDHLLFLHLGFLHHVGGPRAVRPSVPLSGRGLYSEPLG